MEKLTLSPSLTQEIQAEARAARKSVEELLAEALQQYRLEAQRQKISQEAEWWDHVSLETRKKYAGEYVAIHQQKVVDHDPDRAALYDRVRAKYGNLAVLIAPATGTPTLRIFSPRLEQP